MNNQPQELLNFYQKLQKAFEFYFVKHNAKKTILEVIRAIENNQPILPITETEKGSFAENFMSFHSGTEEFQKFKNELHPQLVLFGELAGQIESLTDRYVLYENEPTDAEKEKLLPLLKKFIEILPDFKTFKTWLK